jgi:GNAT superfamily N-acetyltransferase
MGQSLTAGAAARHRNRLDGAGKTAGQRCENPAVDEIWTVAPALVDEPPAALLLRRYYDDIVSRYHGRPTTEAELDQVLKDEPSSDLVPPTGQFLVATLTTDPDTIAERTVPVGCVGVRLLTPEIAEMTRVWLAPEVRGRGGSALLIEAIEEAARELGASVMRLDTRSDLVEARAVYARHGYREIPRYNDDPYVGHWCEKTLR